MIIEYNVLHKDDQVKGEANLQGIDALTSAIKNELVKEILELEMKAAFTESEKGECCDHRSFYHFDYLVH